MRRIAVILLVAAALVLLHHALPMADAHDGHAMGGRDAMPAMIVTCLAVALAAVAVPRIRRLVLALDVPGVAFGAVRHVARVPVMAAAPAHPPPQAELSIWRC
jgi:hypothetical protein